MCYTNSAQIREFQVVSNEAVAQDLNRLVIECPDFALKLKPGQFLNFDVGHDRSELLRVPLSFSFADLTCIEIIYAVVGRATKAMSCWKPGHKSTVIGPLGNGWIDLNPRENVVLVAGGCGITPILGLARYFDSKDIRCNLVVGSRDINHLYTASDSLQPSNDIFITTDDGSCGIHGYTTDALRVLLTKKKIQRIYTCGPTPMMKAIAEIASENQIPCEVSLEKLMACGFGVCTTCNVLKTDGTYARCCSEGPVFMSEDIAW